jgi:hypothetical protein
VQGYFYSAALSGHEATALLGQHMRGFGQGKHLAAS